jgi:hypothetical protein
MLLAQFVCAPQFFKIPKGLCGHTVLRNLVRNAASICVSCCYSNVTFPILHDDHFQHNVGILYDLAQYFRRNFFWESKEACQNTEDKINDHVYTSLKRKSACDPDTNVNISSLSRYRISHFVFLSSVVYSGWTVGIQLLFPWLRKTAIGNRGLNWLRTGKYILWP